MDNETFYKELEQKINELVQAQNKVIQSVNNFNDNLDLLIKKTSYNELLLSQIIRMINNIPLDQIDINRQNNLDLYLALGPSDNLNINEKLDLILELLNNKKGGF